MSESVRSVYFGASTVLVPHATEATLLLHVDRNFSPRHMVAALALGAHIDAVNMGTEQLIRGPLPLDRIIARNVRGWPVLTHTLPLVFRLSNTTRDKRAVQVGFWGRVIIDRTVRYF